MHAQRLQPRSVVFIDVAVAIVIATLVDIPIVVATLACAVLSTSKPRDS